MGNYNPYSPFILGQEWVPIRDEDVIYSPSSNFVELGHEFSLTTSQRVRDARFYVNQLPATPGIYQTTMFNIYPQGREAITGPISSVLIPVNNGGISGNGGSGITLANATTVAQALEFPGDTRYIQSAYNAGVQMETSMFFAVNSYPQLANKRILNVTLVYAGYACDTDEFGNGCTNPLINPNPSVPMTLLYVSSDAFNLRSYQKFFFHNMGSLWQLSNIPDPASASSANNQIFGELNLGDIDLFWDPTSTTVVGSPVMPWRYADLQRFEASAANRLHLQLITQIPSTTQGAFSNAGFIRLEYAALRVTYCEEQRVAYGGYASIGAFDTNYGANVITLRDTSFTADPVLPAGNYTLTLATVNPGDLNYGTGLDFDFPKLNGLRELYALPQHEGVQVNIPVPLSNHLGETFTKVETHVLPQLTLHTSGGPLNEVHVYGRQAIAQVYGSITATQEILDTSIGAASYPQVRYYARRFGDTTVPLRLDSPTITGSNFVVQITPDEFDALDEITAGWKEVTLRFPTTGPTMGTGTNPQWRWSATGELAGNRWEVLGAVAPALSGIPGNMYNMVPSAQRLSAATYGQPSSGATVNLGWMPGYAPPVTATTDDQTADAALMFSQDPPAISGFTVVSASQEIVGIGLDCGVDPCCIPTDIVYNRITWGLPVNTGVASDLFDRTVAAGGWGTASDGKVWTTSGTAANFSVNGAEGVIVPSALGASRMAWLNIGGPDQDVTVKVKINDTPESGALVAGASVRLTDSSNLYRVEFRYQASSNSDLRIRKTVAGSTTTLVSMDVTGLPTSPERWIYLRLQILGNIIMTKVWGADAEEPDWMLITTDGDLTTGNNAGVIARDDTGATSSTFLFDNFMVRPPDYWFGSYELQRMDTVDTTWQTIMRATGVATTGFSDFEARVGVASTYRIRGVNVYDFAGPWSSEASITIPSPGVSGGCLDGGHVLIFTSNERQDGSINLAYSNAWEGQVQEDFSFPESSFVQLQAMYNRDFFTAFRPSERGGEQFQRTILVQAAAISPPTLADFTSLRDMAWEDVSYICVRDEEANRWFATVIVPSGRVTHFRKLYMAQVAVIEVTDTPSEADPS